jgi:two-component system chemotaxis sensor kinase CheA
MEIDHAALLQTFLAESEDNLLALEEALVVLEVTPDDTETVERIFRAAHTLKGNAATLRFSGLTEFAHAVEDLLDRVRQRSVAVTGQLITHLLHAVDALRDLVAAAVDGNHELDTSQRELMALLRDAGSRAPARPSPSTKDSGAQQPEPSSRQAQPTWGDRSATLRVGLDKLDRMLTLTGEIAISRGRIGELLRSEDEQSLEAIRQAHGEADRLYMDLQELVMQVRMVPLGPTFRQHIRTVHDIAAAKGKQAHLVIEGAGVEVDTTVIEQIRDPLTHMVRNTLDHGIELPEARLAQGKDASGRLTLRAYHEAGSVVIQVEDDGAGLDRQLIASRAKSVGLVAEPEKLTDSELYQLILEPGFSTAEAVTELSGRGVGMDVVRRNIESLRGSVTIQSQEGNGTTITVRLPLTLAIIDGFAVGVGDETYVIPLEVVVECLDLPEDNRGQPVMYGLINLRRQLLPYIRLGHLFEKPSTAPSRERVVVVQSGDHRAGLVVDELYGTNQAVVKPLGRTFQNLDTMSGSTILGNGRVALILDVPILLQETIAATASTLNAGLRGQKQDTTHLEETSTTTEPECNVA